MRCRLLLALIAVVVPAGSMGAASALGAPPPNDPPAGAAPFEPYTAPNGSPKQLQAIGDLSGATADPGVPRCLGSASFARTVWYRLPETGTPQQITVEASGRTLDPIDLAAFVQPTLTPAPTPAPTAVPTPVPARASQVLVNTSEPNVCDGVGAGGGADAADATSAVTMLIPANTPVLFQVGRRSTVGSPLDEQALVTLEARQRTLVGVPRGDRAGTATPRLGEGDNDVPLGGATITSEDPAQPVCPSLGTIWRKIVPGSSGKRLIQVSGIAATTLTAFAGSRPTGDNVLDCVNRDRGGTLDLLVPVTKNKPVWVRIGTERTEGDEQASAKVSDGEFATVVDGGSGGFDPTPGGPGGGFPSACDTADASKAAVSGSTLKGTASDRNRFKRVPVAVRVTGSSICDAKVSLNGPRGETYAKARLVRIKPGRSTLRLPRQITFVPGVYRLRVEGTTPLDGKVSVSTKVSGRLTGDRKGRGR